MKFLFLALLSFSAMAQDPNAYLKNFEAKIYSLKTKGVQDFSVDIVSPKLTKQLNDQQQFGKIEELIFRTYWTANPERLAIEVIGLPEGFREVRENLKVSILGVMDNLLPQTFNQRFVGYKFVQGKSSKEILAQDTTGMAPIPSLVLKFDEQDKLVEVVGNRPVGMMNVKPVYAKESFGDGKWVLTSQTTTSIENGQTITVEKELEYGKANGIGVLTDLTIRTTQKADGPQAKPFSASDNVTFSNYKSNEGTALKYFLGEGKASPPPAKKP